MSAEDGLSDTIRPRLDSLGGDPSKVHVLQAIKQNETERPFCLASDIPHLESAISQTGAILVVIDPLSAYLGKTESYKDSEVRSLLAPLASMAEKTGVAVVAVMHLTKDNQRKAIYRAPGSIAFVGAARIVLAVAKDPDDETRRVLSPIKTNLSAPPPTLAFSVMDGVLRWDDKPFEGTNIDSILSGSSSPEEKEERREADEFLLELLREGEVAATEVYKAARGNGISDRTLNRAKLRLRIKSRKVGYAMDKAAWYWALPKIANTPANIATPGNVAIFDDHIENKEENSNTSSKIASYQTVAIFGGNLRENDGDRLSPASQNIKPEVELGGTLEDF